MEPESTPPETKDLMKIDPPDTEKQGSSKWPQEKPNSGEDGLDRGDIKTELKLTNEASDGVYLFRTYMATKAPTKNISKVETDAEGPGSSRRPLLPPQFGCNGPRPATLLERELLPQMRNTQFSDCKSAASQLTIFYAGTIHVYNDVPVDKAQEIMLLAGESSLTKPMVAKSADIIKTIPLHPRQTFQWQERIRFASFFKSVKTGSPTKAPIVHLVGDTEKWSQEKKRARAIPGKIFIALLCRPSLRESQ